MRNPRYLRVVKDHVDESGEARKRNDLRMVERPRGFEHIHDARVNELLASGLYEEVPDGKTRLPD
jgi:hypothetical protein